MTDVVVDRVRIRGTDARRLARVAARTLPGALDGALADLADGALDRLEVRLDLDPADYDDATLALLWADRIRSAALAAGARVRSVPEIADAAADAATSHGADPTVPSGHHAGPAPGDASVDDVVAAVRAWLETGASATAVPRCVALLATPSLAGAVVGRLGDGRARELARALARVAALLPPGGPVADPSDVAGDGDGIDRAAMGRAPDDPRPAPPGRRAGGEPPHPAADDVAAQGATLLRHLDLAAAGGDAAATTVDLTGSTIVAGLVLCYPWLTDLCRDAERHHPRAEPVHVRRVALAVLAAGPDDHADLLDDPLIRFLAGAPDAAPSASALAPLDTEPLGDLTDAVLRRFAGLLRGFERSSPAFVRTSWLARAGVLEVDRDPVRLLAAPLPLDVVLHLLPYPVSLLRLPWTGPLTVRFLP